jgi:5,5'-dehydrodivanillate O-demethylase oxygenase subunit
MAVTSRETATAQTPSGYTAADWTDFVHTGPDTLAGRYLRRFWHPIYVAKDLALGASVPLTVMKENFTLYRGHDGTPHLLEAHCAHQGMLLHVGWVEEDCIRCFFHGWKYDGTGQCIEQPGEDEAFKARIKLRSYPVQEYLGLIFAYLGEGEAPTMPRYADFEREGIIENNHYALPCNYFQHIESSPIHSLFVHGGRRLVKKPPPKVWAEESEWGIAEHAEYPGYPGVRTHHRGLPNITHVINDPRDEESGYQPVIAWTIPTDDEHLVHFGVYHVGVTGDAARRYQAERAEFFAKGGRTYDHALTEAVLAGKLRIEEVRQRTDIDIGRVEDGVAYLGVGTILDRSREHLGRNTDAGNILFRQIWIRELQALAQHRPLKPWTRTERCVATPQTVPWQRKKPAE